MQAAYGRLRGDSLRLEPGLNLIYAPNESGKSTWCSFIRTMLYGLPTRQSGPLADKNRFAPWTGEAMQGRMDLETGGQRWTVLRDTRRASAPMQNFACTYTGTAQPVPEVNGQNLGETLLGVPREVFQRSAFIGQSGLAVSQDPELERRIANFVGTDDAILYSSCFDANGGLFETLLGPEDAVISDELNHASIIDGVRLCKAKRYRYLNNNMEDLEAKLKDARESGCKKILIATDGVFSMDGYIANLKAICDLADRYDALTMVDDSHAVGFMGTHGRGTAEFCGVIGRVDIITGTFGKAMGGASGGYTAARQPIVDLLRQRSRPYLFSNTLAPAICAATLRTIDLLEESTALRDKVHENARYFRAEMEKLGFDLLPGEHPIVPVMLYDPKIAQEFARRMLEKGVYVVGFCYPVVPKGRDRIRTQISAGHTKEDLDFAVRCFGEVKKEMGL